MICGWSMKIGRIISLVLLMGSVVPTMLFAQPREAALAVHLPPKGTQSVPAPEPATIVLDAGHGGVQSGAFYNNIAEKEITLPVTELVASQLKAQGYRVIMTRTQDIDIGLYERAEVANAAQANIMVSIHANALDGYPDVQGIMFYHYPSSAEGQELSEALESRFAKESIRSRGIHTADFVVLREPQMSTTLIELGFMSNRSELRRLTTDEYQAQLARAISDGIHAYIIQNSL